MSVINLSYPCVFGNVALSYDNIHLPVNSYMCSCPCHNASWMGVKIPYCRCKCSKVTTLKIIVEENL
jgi:hypothetical protein